MIAIMILIQPHCQPHNPKDLCNQKNSEKKQNPNEEAMNTYSEKTMDLCSKIQATQAITADYRQTSLQPIIIPERASYQFKHRNHTHLYSSESPQQHPSTLWIFWRNNFYLIIFCPFLSYIKYLPHIFIPIPFPPVQNCPKESGKSLSLIFVPYFSLTNKTARIKEGKGNLKETTTYYTAAETSKNTQVPTYTQDKTPAANNTSKPLNSFFFKKKIYLELCGSLVIEGGGGHCTQRYCIIISKQTQGKIRSKSLKITKRQNIQSLFLGCSVQRAQFYALKPKRTRHTSEKDTQLTTETVFLSTYWGPHWELFFLFHCWTTLIADFDMEPGMGAPTSSW
ncbi:hypothetical protein VP01_1710g1 [Puccinia sorghi]|uniref:Uncharacterized protein n=1 Tax=Puccinia sorghi TaxID=27349 RepID=A0A0L6VFJ1_9BASI|nr:hypothetical protein VP01_1710g1 [Puccinia sorghi]